MIVYFSKGLISSSFVILFFKWTIEKEICEWWSGKNTLQNWIHKASISQILETYYFKRFHWLRFLFLFWSLLGIFFFSWLRFYWRGGMTYWFFNRRGGWCSLLVFFLRRNCCFLRWNWGERFWRCLGFKPPSGTHTIQRRSLIS